MGYMASAPCTDANERIPESPRSSSCMMRPYATLFSPAHPYSSGRFAPNTPSDAISGTSSFGNFPSTYASPMIGSTRSSTKPRTLSRTARSSSERRVSIAKKSIIVGESYSRRRFASSRRHDTTREWRDAERPGLLPERAAVIDRHAALVLPLMHHLVQQRLQRFVPAVPAQVAATDRDFRRIPGLGGRGVVAQPRTHAAGHPYLDRPQLAAEQVGVESRVLLSESRGEPFVVGVGTLARAAGRQVVRDDR